MDRLVSKAEHILAGTAHDEHPDMHHEHPDMGVHHHGGKDGTVERAVSLRSQASGEF